jgi:hypothetical protein
MNVTLRLGFYAFKITFHLDSLYVAEVALVEARRLYWLAVGPITFNSCLPILTTSNKSFDSVKELLNVLRGIKIGKNQEALKVL